MLTMEDAVYNDHLAIQLYLTCKANERNLHFKPIVWVSCFPNEEVWLCEKALFFSFSFTLKESLLCHLLLEYLFDPWVIG